MPCENCCASLKLLLWGQDKQEDPGSMALQPLLRRWKSRPTGNHGGQTDFAPFGMPGGLLKLAETI